MRVVPEILSGYSAAVALRIAMKEAHGARGFDWIMYSTPSPVRKAEAIWNVARREYMARPDAPGYWRVIDVDRWEDPREEFEAPQAWIRALQDYNVNMGISKSRKESKWTPFIALGDFEEYFEGPPAPKKQARVWIETNGVAKIGKELLRQANSRAEQLIEAAAENRREPSEVNQRVVENRRREWDDFARWKAAITGREYADVYNAVLREARLPEWDGQ